LGSGSDRCIKYFFEVNKSKNLIITNPTFPMYNVYSQIFGLNTISVDYDGVEFPYEDFIKNITKDSIVVISNPVSPIGNKLGTEYIRQILEVGAPTLIDEAYIEFSHNNDTAIDLINEYDNLYVCRTFSKALGSAGMRIGVLLSQKQNIDNVLQYRDMYETTGITIKWIETLMNNQQYIDKYVNNVKKTRKQLETLLSNRGIEHLKSDCNWVHIRGDFNIPENIILKENCTVPGLGNDWIRLCITDNINDYTWIAT
jgi:histidinol-phosphate aminotransferase